MSLTQLTSLQGRSDTADVTAFFSRQLEHMKTRMYDILYPEYKATSFFPVSTEAGPGAETIVYEQMDTVGIMKIIASYSDDLPRADVVGKEFSSIIRSLGGSYGWNLQEVRTASQAGKSLNDKKARAGRKAYDFAVDQIGWFGDAPHGLLGFLDQPNVPAGPVQVGAVSGNTVWIGATPKTNDEKLEDMADAVSDVMTLTKGVHNPDTLILPLSRYNHVKARPRSTTTETTVLQYFLNNHLGVTVDWANELDAVANPPSGAGGPLNVMAAYTRSIDMLSFELPQLYEQLPVQERGLEFLVPTHARIGGVIVYYPLSISFIEGI